MMTWNRAQLYTRRQAQIGTGDTDAITFLDMMINQGYKELLAVLGRQLTEKIKVASTVADQRSYQVPPDCAWVKNVSVTDGSTKYVLSEEQSEVMWDYITQTDQTGLPDRFFYRPRFGVGGGVIEFDPIPGQVYTVRLTYEATDKDLGQDSYTAGSVDITNQSATVTGNGTTFTSDMVGRYFRVSQSGADRLWYRVKAFNSTTSLTLENYYEGATQTSASYEIAEVFNLPEDLQMLPCYYAMWQWWESKKDTQQALKFLRYWEGGIRTARTHHGVKTRDNIVRYDDLSSPFPQAMPSYFPSDGVS